MEAGQVSSLPNSEISRDKGSKQRHQKYYRRTHARINGKIVPYTKFRMHKYQRIKDFPIFSPIDWNIDLLPFDNPVKIPELKTYLTPNNNTIKEIIRIRSFKESNFKTHYPP